MTIEAYVESKMDPEDLQDKQAALIRELQDHMQGYDNGTPVSVSASADESQFHERSYAPPVPPAGGWIAAPADLQASCCVRLCVCAVLSAACAGQALHGAGVVGALCEIMTVFVAVVMAGAVAASLQLWWWWFYWRRCCCCM